MSKQVKVVGLDNLDKFKGKIDEKLGQKANKSEVPQSLPANGGNADTVGGASVVTTAALGLHKMASGTAAANSTNCPPGAWYGQYE